MTFPVARSSITNLLTRTSLLGVLRQVNSLFLGESHLLIKWKGLATTRSCVFSGHALVFSFQIGQRDYLSMLVVWKRGAITNRPIARAGREGTAKHSTPNSVLILEIGLVYFLEHPEES